MSTTAKTLTAQLAHLYATEASRDHLLKDGMRTLNAAEVAYVLGFRQYRTTYREPMPRGRRGWLAKDVKAHLERGRTTPSTAAQATRKRTRGRASVDAPIWGAGTGTDAA